MFSTNQQYVKNILILIKTKAITFFFFPPEPLHKLPRTYPTLTVKLAILFASKNCCRKDILVLHHSDCKTPVSQTLAIAIRDPVCGC